MNIEEIRKEMTREEFIEKIYANGECNYYTFNYKDEIIKCPNNLRLKDDLDICNLSDISEFPFKCKKCWLNAIKDIKFKGEEDNIEKYSVDPKHVHTLGDNIKLSEGNKIRSGDMNKVKLHEQICGQLHEMYICKNQDYGDSFGETFNKLGIISAITRITDKVNRLQSLCTKDALVDEKIEDTLLDAANYCILTLIELELNKKEEEK